MQTKQVIYYKKHWGTDIMAIKDLIATILFSRERISISNFLTLLSIISFVLSISLKMLNQNLLMKEINLKKRPHSGQIIAPSRVVLRRVSIDLYLAIWDSILYLSSVFPDFSNQNP
jgi:hypothetical protein